MPIREPSLRLHWPLVLLAGFWLLVLAPASANAAEASFSSYISPFPASDRYRLFLFGDSLAAGLAQPLTGELATQGVEVVNKSAPGLGLARSDGTEWDKVVDTIPQTEGIQIAVLMFGADDRVSIRLPKQRFEFGTPGWRDDYSRRVDSLLKALHSRNVAIYWLGLPIMRTDGATAAAQLVNGIERERVRLSGAKYIDSWDAFVDADGTYSDQGPDLTGIVKPLRLPDGVHMTPPGYQKLASLVTRELTHDLSVAKRERDVPLAGDEGEQQNVRDESLPRAAGSTAGANAKAGKSAGKAVQDYPADDGSVALGAASSGQPLTIALVRPAIPGAAVSQIVASHSAQQTDVGHTMPADLMGGYTVLSSVATSLDANQSGKQRLPLTENPFYKLLIRGDVLPPKPGRVDDFQWPRPGVAEPAPAEPNG